MNAERPKDRLRRMRLAAYGPEGDAPDSAGRAGAGPAHRREAAGSPSGSEGPGPSERWSMRPGLVARVGLAVVALAIVVGVGGVLTGAWGPGADAGTGAAEHPGLLLPRGSPRATGSTDLPGARDAPSATGVGPGSRQGATPNQVYVHVAGHVADPGLIHLDDGARVATAIEAAGGATDEADLSRVNLAAQIADGQQIYVPATGEPGPPVPAVGSGTAATTAAAVIDVNTAGPAQLETLPGIGPARAADVIAWREENGPFETVEDLLEVPGIGPATLERLRERVRV